MAEIENLISYFNSDIELNTIPAWDTSPYDISSPNKEILGKELVD